MATALITGILGQDGSLLAERLLAHDYRVVGVMRPGSVIAAELRTPLAGCELVEVDLATTGWADSLVQRITPDEVYHLAACHHSSERRDDPAQQQRMVAVNYAACLALAHAVLARGRGRLVIAASSQMYTPSTPHLRVDEATPRAPASFYGVTKANTLDAIAWLRARQGLAASTAILFNHESPRRPASFVTRKITRATARIAAGLDTTVELLDTASAVDFTCAHDIVAGLHALARAEPADRVFASGELHTIADVCSVAFATVGLDWQHHVRSQRPPGGRPALVGDPTRSERELGWQRRHSFAAWIEEMVHADRRRIAEGAADDE